VGVDAPTTVGCTEAASPNTFDGVASCQPWGGVITGPASTLQSGGELVIAPDANAIGQGGCTGDAPLTDGGLFVELAASLPSTTPSAYTGISFYEGVELPFAIYVENDQLTALDYATLRIDVPYDPVAMRWWRLRPIAGQVTFEIAPDGLSWTALGTSPRVAPASTVTKNLVAGVSSPEPTPGTARYASVDVSVMRSLEETRSNHAC
jgi:hypothetical protein